MGDKKTIAVVGAGPAGLAAALALTDPELNPGWRDAYDVVVLQMGWRAGGKGATGRRAPVVADGDGWQVEGPAPILEHGIHLFGSMYVNATRLLARCYDELPLRPGEPPMTMDDELVPSNYMRLADFVDRRWELTSQILPHNDLVPWGPQDAPDPATLVGELVRLVLDLLAEAFGPGPAAGAAAAAGEDDHPHGLLADLRRLHARHRDHPRLPHAAHHADALVALEGARAVVEAAHDAARGTDRAARLRSVWCQIELYTTVARGVLSDDIFGRGLQVVDDEDFVSWCRRHGMAEAAIASSPVQLPAQMCFQVPDGDVAQPPNFSASGYLWFVLRQVLACGQASYWFRRGTGDSVIAPYYRVAAARGVQFRFFRKVTHLGLDAASGTVDRIELDVQATTVDGAPYDPLVRLPDGGYGWPDRPIYAQLAQGAELEAAAVDLESWWSPWEPVGHETLRLGEDFDQVVCALPLPCLPHVAPELVARAAWAPAVDAMGGSATLAAQIWTDRTTEELGFPRLKGTDRVCGGAAVPPLGFADMTDVLAAEAWPEGAGPSGLLYLCGPLAHDGPWPPFDAHDTPAVEDERARATVVQWLRTAVSVLPEAGTDPFTPEAFDLAALWCPPGEQPAGEERFGLQYWRANIDPNERYVPSPPGSGALRPQAWESGATNLALASDWIFTGMNIGSFEGAVMSGLLASYALTGAPSPDRIVGYAFARPDLAARGAAAPPG